MALSKLLLITLTFLLLGAVLSINDDGTCDHDKLEHNPQVLEEVEEDLRNLAQESSDEGNAGRALASVTYNKLLLITLTFLLLGAVLSINDDGTCDHDKLEHNPQVLEEVEEDLRNLAQESSDEENAGRALASVTYNKLRIRPYYGLLSSAPSSFRSYVQNELAPPVISYLSAALPVKYPVSGLLKVSSTSVCGKSTPSELRSGVTADYYVMFDHHYVDSSTVASSTTCYMAAKTTRPLVGYTIFNRNMINVANGDILVHEKNTYLLIHEMMHALGYSNDNFPRYITSTVATRTGHIISKSIGGTTHKVLNIATLTTKLRNYYGCSSIPGLILEEDGGSGTAVSHPERKFFVYDVMASGNIFGRRVSEITLTVLEMSGWYAPNYNYAEPFFFGQGQGCNFINQQCSNTKTYFDEFCTGSTRGCAPQGRSGGYCAGDAKADNCRYVSPNVDFDCENPDGEDYARFPTLEVYGRTSNSKCFTGTLNTRSTTTSKTSFCFKYTCVGSGSSTQLQVKIGTGTYNCNTKGTMSVKGYYGVVNCPDPLEFCSTVGKKYCPRGCMGRGTCSNNVCVCNKGYTGIDCGLTV